MTTRRALFPAVLVALADLRSAAAEVEPATCRAPRQRCHGDRHCCGFNLCVHHICTGYVNGEPCASDRVCESRKCAARGRCVPNRHLSHHRRHHRRHHHG